MTSSKSPLSLPSRPIDGCFEEETIKANPIASAQIIIRKRSARIRSNGISKTKALASILQISTLAILILATTRVAGFSSPSLRSLFLREDLASAAGHNTNGIPMFFHRSVDQTATTRRIHSGRTIHASRLRGWTEGRRIQHGRRSSSSMLDASMAVPADENDDGSSDVAEDITDAAPDASTIAASASATATTTGRKIRDFWTRLVTGERPGSAYLRKPKWLSKSSKLARVLPTWVFHLRPSVQLLATLVLYLFHTIVLAQNSLVFPLQLIPNDRGNFNSIGFDTLAGMGTLAFYQYLRRMPTNFFDIEVEETSRTSESVPLNATAIYSADDPNATTSSEGNATTTMTTITTAKTTTTAYNASFLPDLWSAPHPKNMPWKNIWKSKFSRISSLAAFATLTRAYFFTGRCSLFWEDWLYGMARYWTWMTVPMHRSLTVLLGHLSWVAIGGLILRLVPRPQPFFQEPLSQWFMSRYRGANPEVAATPGGNSEDADGNEASSPKTTLTPGQLLEYSSQQSRHPQWIWWAIGGYYVSSWFFNIADFINSYAFPMAVLEQAEENSVVAKLVNPEGSDLLASIVGYIAPCLTAPWWEEVLYRGFLLPTFVLQLGHNRYHLATFLSGVLFSVHHQSELAFLPLCVLGWTWAVLYTKSKNLWTTILIHCMWNSRIFLGGWFGL